MFLSFARVEGFEPPSTVLETAILPLNYTRLIKNQQHQGVLLVLYLLIVISQGFQ